MENKNENIIRNCPNCKIEIKYSSLRKLKIAENKNSLCRKCSKTGENNPMYGKTGNKHHAYGIIRENMIGENNPAKRVEVKKKISEKLTGRIGAMTGKQHTQETKDKISTGNIGQIRTQETKDKIRLATLKQIENGLHSSNPFCKKRKYKNTNLHYQGSFELDFLNKYFHKIKIENGKNFYYIIENENRIYISDFFLPDYNLIIEIKSSWTFNKEINKNQLKKESVLKNNTNFLFIIDKNYNELNKIIKDI